MSKCGKNAIIRFVNYAVTQSGYNNAADISMTIKSPSIAAICIEGSGVGFLLIEISGKCTLYNSTMSSYPTGTIHGCVPVVLE